MLVFGLDHYIADLMHYYNRVWFVDIQAFDAYAVKRVATRGVVL